MSMIDVRKRDGVWIASQTVYNTELVVTARTQRKAFQGLIAEVEWFERNLHLAVLRSEKS